jgi:3-hydroxyisobutyrate dehydrogenase
MGLAVRKQRIGFVGLGVMGLPMARHLATAGFPLSVFDLNPAPLAQLAHQSGVVVAQSLRAVAEASDIVITMLPSGREVSEVVLGKGGLLRGFKAGDLLLDTSSSEPWHTREIAAQLAEHDVGMVDAPVSGAEAGAIAAELVFMVGGDAAAVKRVMPLLNVLGRRVFHLGPVGAGHVMKSINNLVTAVTFMATAEGLILGTGCGLDPAAMNEVLNESTGMSWITRNHIEPRILSRRFDDPFKLDLMMKDINIALQLAAGLPLRIPLSAWTQARWDEIRAASPKASSVSEIVRRLEIEAGIEIIPKQPPPKID